MPFPESPRVFYGKNPLEEVVVQLRFPPVLRVQAETPAPFQDQIRAAFPLYGRPATLSGLSLPMPLSIPPELMQLIAGGTQPAHEFRSADRIWTLTLNRDFIALSTTTYTKWSEFRDQLAKPLAALREIYSPAFFTRIGLRYRDRIDRKKLGLEGVPWTDLLNPQVLGELADPNIGPNVEHMLREIVIRLSGDEGRVRVVHGLEQAGQHYVIDADFFIEGQIETGAAQNVLHSYNRRAGRLFRWCIQDRLHRAMDPRTATGT